MKNSLNDPSEKGNPEMASMITISGFQIFGRGVVGGDEV